MKVQSAVPILWLHVFQSFQILIWQKSVVPTTPSVSEARGANLSVENAMFAADTNCFVPQPENNSTLMKTRVAGAALAH